MVFVIVVKLIQTMSPLMFMNLLMESVVVEKVIQTMSHHMFTNILMESVVVERLIQITCHHMFMNLLMESAVVEKAIHSLCKGGKGNGDKLNTAKEKREQSVPSGFGGIGSCKKYDNFYDFKRVDKYR